MWRPGSYEPNGYSRLTSQRHITGGATFRIRFLGRTRFRADHHSYPFHGPMAIALMSVLSCFSSPTVSGTSILFGLRTPVGSFAMRPAFPTSDYYAP